MVLLGLVAYMKATRLITTLGTPINSATDPTLQRWIRAPKGTDTCPWTGLRRTALYALAKRARGSIRVLNLKEPGARRGCVLFWLPSVNAYLHGMAESQEQDLSEPQIEALGRGDGQ